MDIGMRQFQKRSEHEGTVKEGRISGYYAICPPCRYKGPKREYRIAAYSDLRETHFGIKIGRAHV